jgi:hypothetical protein
MKKIIFKLFLILCFYGQLILGNDAICIEMLNSLKGYEFYLKNIVNIIAVRNVCLKDCFDRNSSIRILCNNFFDKEYSENLMYDFFDKKYDSLEKEIDFLRSLIIECEFCEFNQFLLRKFSDISLIIVFIEVTCLSFLCDFFSFRNNSNDMKCGMEKIILFLKIHHSSIFKMLEMASVLLADLFFLLKIFNTFGNNNNYAECYQHQTGLQNLSFHQNASFDSKPYGYSNNNSPYQLLFPHENVNVASENVFSSYSNLFKPNEQNVNFENVRTSQSKENFFIAALLCIIIYLFFKEKRQIEYHI